LYKNDEYGCATVRARPDSARRAERSILFDLDQFLQAVPAFAAIAEVGADGRARPIGFLARDGADDVLMLAVDASSGYCA
jgi:hypothetical protein